MKKFSLLLAICLLHNCIPSAHATETNFDDSLLDAQVAEIMRTYNLDPATAESALAAIDVELVCEPNITEHTSNSNTRGTAPTDYTFTVTCYKRSNSSLIHMQWLLEANAKEWFPGPLDYASLEWDTAYASYYSSSGDSSISTVQGRDTGIVLFNLEDDKLSSGGYTYGTVRVDPIANGWMEFGSKFVHTYTSLFLSGTASASFGSSAEIKASGDYSLGLSHTMGFTLTVSSTTNEWKIWEDNAVNLT